MLFVVCVLTSVQLLELTIDCVLKKNLVFVAKCLSIMETSFYPAYGRVKARLCISLKANVVCLQSSVVSGSVVQSGDIFLVNTHQLILEMSSICSRVKPRCT